MSELSLATRLRGVARRVTVAKGASGKLRAARVVAGSRIPGTLPGFVEVPVKSLGGVEISVRPGTTDLTNVADYHSLRLYMPPPEVADEDLRVVWELGSNIGAALVGLAATYPSASVLGVEPDPGNQALAAMNVAQFGERVRTVNAAIWDHRAKLIVDATDGGAHGFVVREMQPGDPAERAVDALGIADLLDDHLEGQEVDYMHVSIEGTEPKAFASHGWVERVRSLRVEAHPYFGYSARDCVAQLEGIGYKARPAPEMPDKWVYAVRR